MNTCQSTNKNSSVLAFWICIAVMISIILILPPDENKKSTQTLNHQSENHEVLPERKAACLAEKNVVPAHAKNPESSFQSIIQKAAELNDVDPALVKAIIMAESSFNPRAVSKKGAKGLMQLMPVTAETLGVKDIFNPEHNINGGVRYFKKLIIRFNGDTRLALAAYNAGINKVRRYQGVPPFKATKYYIRKVFKYYKYYKERAPETDKV